METVEQLTKISRDAQAKLWQIEAVKRRNDNGAKVCKTFRTRNSYSCPEKPSDYWWLYAKITRMDEGGLLYATTFQVDKYGHVYIAYDTCVHHAQYYTSCTAVEFNKAWRRLLKKLKDTF
jgi:hypothetical protein